MRTVNYEQYNAEKVAFIKKHNARSECNIETSPFIENGYNKVYSWEHGANWYEVMEIVEEEVEFEHRGLKFTTKVEMWRTEYWSSEFGSRYLYEIA